MKIFRGGIVKRLAKTFIFYVFILLVFPATSHAGGFLIVAEDITITLLNQAMELSITAMEANKPDIYRGAGAYLTKHLVVSIAMENKTGEVIIIKPKDFTLISSFKRSYPVFENTDEFKKEITWIWLHPLTHVNLQPGTVAVGFLLFNRTAPEERPAKLAFDNNKYPQTISIEQHKPTKE